jgi:hypothetical protein
MQNLDMPTDDDPVTLIQGDALEVLDRLSGVDLVLTDPPFGIALSNHSPGVCMDGTERRRTRETSIANDHDTAVAEAVIRWADSRELPLCVFASPYRPLPGPWRNVLVWDKGPAVGGGGDPATCWKRTFELVYTRRNRPLNGPRDEAVLPFPVNTGADFQYHPCQKPVALLRYLIRQLTQPAI